MVEISLYFHVPFCTKKCPYCHFYVVADKEPFKEALSIGFEREWQQIIPQIMPYKLVSIYFGGGTPSLFGPKRIERVIEMVHKTHSFDESIEITLEANPENVTKESLLAYRSTGVNRISLGVQSFEEEKLATLGRTHSCQKALHSVYLAKESGFDNISIDLMYDLPGQTLKGWHDTLDQAVKLPITHLSLYNLTIEPHTGFARKEKELKAKMPDDEASAKMYLDAISRLAANGFCQYEISAFCKDDLYSRHNTGYWTGRYFWGLGPSAFSYFGNKRFRNCANLNRYAQLLEQGVSPVDFEEELEPPARRRELLALEMRMRKGVEISRFGPLEKEILDKLQALDLITQVGDRTCLTQKGVLFYDTIAAELI